MTGLSLKLALASLATNTLLGPAYAQNKTFDFLGFRTEVVAPPIVDLAGKKCKVAQSGISQCVLHAGAVIGRARPLELTVTFNNAHMVTISGWVLLNSYADITEAFSTKYGPADTTAVKPWQNQLGMTFDNAVQTWTFVDGTLELRQRGNQRDLAEFSFVANKNLPEQLKHQEPPVNF